MTAIYHFLQLLKTARIVGLIMEKVRLMGLKRFKFTVCLYLENSIVLLAFKQNKIENLIFWAIVT
jgi:hypothetical protein